MIDSSPVAYAVNRIMSVGVDKTILQLKYGGINSMGIRKNIAQEIDRVLVRGICNDFNLISGDVIDIPVSKCRLIDGSDGRLYIVPPEARRHRDIREVLTMKKKAYVASIGADMYTVPTSSSPILDGLVSMGSSMGVTEPNGSTMVELEDDNMIRVTTNNGSLYGFDTFVVDIENRDRLRRLKRGSYPLFSKMAIAYIKSDIYSDRLSLRKAAIHGGHELSEVSSEIDSYSGALEEYDTYISENAGKMLTFSDESKLNSIYQHMA